MRRYTRPAQYLALLSAAIAMVAVVGSLYGVPVLMRMSPRYLPMALSSSLTFLILAAGILALRPEEGLMRIVISRSTGGVMARRLLPVGFLLPVALGYIRLNGQRLGWYGTELASASFALSGMVLATLFIWWVADAIYRIDHKRYRAEKQIDVQYAISRLLSRSARLQDVAPLVLRRICQTLDWDVGFFWMPGPDEQTLYLRGDWYHANSELQDYAKRSRQFVLPKGIGISGRAWEMEEALWLPDGVTDLNLRDFPRVPLAVRRSSRGLCDSGHGRRKFTGRP